MIRSRIVPCSTQNHFRGGRLHLFRTNKGYRLTVAPTSLQHFKGSSRTVCVGWRAQCAERRSPETAPLPGFFPRCSDIVRGSPAVARQKALGAHVPTETAPTGGALVPAASAQAREALPSFRESRYSPNCCVRANHVAQRTICLLERYHVQHNFFLPALKSKIIIAYDQKTRQLLAYWAEVVFPATHESTRVAPRTSFLKPFSVCLEIALGSIHNT